MRHTLRHAHLLAGATCIAAAVALATAHLAHAKKPAPPADEYDFLIVSYDAYGGWWPFAWSGQHSGDGPTVPPVAGHTFGGSEHMPASETLTLESYWNGGAVIELTGLTYTTTPAKTAPRKLGFAVRISDVDTDVVMLFANHLFVVIEQVLAAQIPAGRSPCDLAA